MKNDVHSTCGLKGEITEGAEVVRERPILMSAPMVRATLREVDPKWQTRRVINPQPVFEKGYWASRGHVWKNQVGARSVQSSPYGVPGDRLWVRETFWGDATTKAFKWYVNDIFTPERERDHCKLIPGIFMPRAISRLTLEITDVRVQRLQEISEADALAEGCEARLSGTWWQGYRDTGEKLGLMHTQHQGDEPPDWMIEPHKMNPTHWLDRSAKHYFEQLWDSINGKRPGCAWSDNPWVWVVSFPAHHGKQPSGRSQDSIEL